ncbi:MAG: class II aldolase/adducin family protein [Anaerolineaceae bacterium]|nr:class II aldolase/adducin family protein [Anaerolineaceae bacterium]
MDNFSPFKQQIVVSCQKLVAEGYLMATGGNVSMRILNQNAFAVTPSNYDYARMSPDDVCVLNFDLHPLAGQLKPSVEAAMHGAIYQMRNDVNAIAHTHQVYTSALSLINAPIPALFDEQVRFLGRSVEIIPYAPSGTGLLKNRVAKHVNNHNNAFILQNHGALVFGHDMERALHNVEILEKCALAYLLAICSERKISKIPLAVREIAFAKLRQDQKNADNGKPMLSGG